MMKSGCKINLFLRVLGRRPDGYHDIESLFLPLAEPHDEIHVTPLADSHPGPVHDRLRCVFLSPASGGSAPLPLSGIDPQTNTLSRAYSLYAIATGFAPRLGIRVIKRVPAGAGLGGGSANAAALLRYLQRMAANSGLRPLDAAALVALASRVGADVPFFLQDGPALVGGIGEKLTPCASPFPGLYLVLVCPGLRVSTAWAFAALDKRRLLLPLPASSSQKNGEERLTTGQPRATTSLVQAQDFKNDFEDLVFAHFPELARLHGFLCGSGAELARMSGTGASLFALYRDKRIAREAAKTLANENASVYTQRLPAG